MATCIGQCVPVYSSWIREVILTPNCTLAVWFKNGFCCEYPATTPAWFNQMLAAPSKGHWLHVYLYKKLAYRRIRPPCPPSGGIVAACCPANALPATLYASLTGAGPLNGSYPLSYAASPSPAWRLLTALGSCATGALSLSCSNPGLGGGSPVWSLFVEGDAQNYQPTSVNCSPLQLVFSNVITGNCGGTAITTVTITT